MDKERMGRDTVLCLGYHYIKYAEQNPLFLTVFPKPLLIDS